MLELIDQPMADTREHMLELIDQPMADTREHIRDHVKRHPELARQVELIESIPGLGQPTAVKLVVEFMNIAVHEHRRVRGCARLRSLGRCHP